MEKHGNGKQIVSTRSWDACLQNRHCSADCNELKNESFYMEKTQQ